MENMCETRQAFGGADRVQIEDEAFRQLFFMIGVPFLKDNYTVVMCFYGQMIIRYN